MAATTSQDFYPNSTFKPETKDGRLNYALLGLILGSVALLTIVMNILVLYAVKKERTLHTVGNLYIVSLSVADLMVGATVMPLNIVYLLEKEWRLGQPLCQFWLVMDYVASTASIFSLFILCIDRYRSVRYPLRYLKYRTRARASAMISTAWLISMTWMIPILGWRTFANVELAPERELKCDTDFRFVTWFKVLTAVLNFYVPSLMMLWFYAQIYLAVRKHFKQRENISETGFKMLPWQKHKCKERPAPDLLEKYSLEQFLYTRTLDEDLLQQTQENNKEMTYHQSPQAGSASELGEPEEGGNDEGILKQGEMDNGVPCLQANGKNIKQSWQRFCSSSKQYLQSLHMRKERKAAKQLGFIMAGFMLCWIPYFVTFMVMAFCKTCVHHDLHMFTIWLGYINSTLNPFIYPLCNENFKRTFKSVLHLPF
ncbi:histamine H1 receptor isoform X2 [Erpetoichthys calabaricus]|nr:histamine H1 receptor isoform X2 [Erpetoichthys calabaricus]